MGQYAAQKRICHPGGSARVPRVGFGLAETVFPVRVEEFEKSAKPGRLHRHAKRARGAEEKSHAGSRSNSREQLESFSSF